ncbi:flagellar hook-basal body protein [Gracilibacillus thailandensis]|jgi:flagellar basal-body rod protein FlgF|uniref:Flagellar hook-basal body complex protein n=1 Tax=Gracilibacillus thailandensis TaxID=563735 RepID=A0A6N7R615_9BACI|nr:flagellar hook-basal body protein [Gracilibacillus thailandensis]MRI68604.1 flagellar hook-basal body complex protein [Gracilibacillus thailandensis]
MLRGFYTATNGMMAQQRRQEVLSNNMTNAQTPGYKQDQTPLRAFPELLIQRMENRDIPNSQGTSIPTMTEIGAINTGVYVHETIPDFVQGSLKETGVSTDMALVQGETPDEEGSIFYTVQNGEGDIRYTRNGNFTVDGEGNLTTTNGYYVLDDEGNPINTDNLAFTVTPEGMVQLDDGEVPLGIAYSANPNDLVKNGQDLFELAEDGAALVDARGVDGLQFNVQQNHLENSNVDPAQTMTDMMQAYRSFEANQKVVQQYDRSLDKAVNEIARLG